MTAEDDLQRSIAGLIQLSRQFGVNLDNDIARLQVEISALNITQQQLEVHRNNIARMMDTIQNKVSSRIEELQDQVDKQRKLKETFEQVYGESTAVPHVDITETEPQAEAGPEEKVEESEPEPQEGSEE